LLFQQGIDFEIDKDKECEMGKTCFVISPIGLNGSYVRENANKLLEHIIEPVCKEKGYRVLRADKMATTGIITMEIVEQILTADIVVADLTGGNPNVFYELAARHAFEKPAIQMIMKDEKIPFDVSVVRTILYSYDVSEIACVKDELRSKIDSIENGEEVRNPVNVVANMLGISANSYQEQSDYLTSFLIAIQDKMDTSLRKLHELEYIAAGDAVQEAHGQGVIVGDPYGDMDLMRSVNRAEFAVLIIRALCIPESVLSKYGLKLPFKDSVGYGWAVPYLSFCLEKGIFRCDTDGNIRPGERVTISEAIYMTLHACGCASLEEAKHRDVITKEEKRKLDKDISNHASLIRLKAAEILNNLILSKQMRNL
jgi:hypothetical protein